MVKFTHDDMKRTVPIIVCPKCHGAGLVELSDDMNSTLTAVRKMRQATAQDVKRSLDKENMFHPTAFNNRLTHLMSLGLVVRKKQSRRWVYSCK